MSLRRSSIIALLATSSLASLVARAGQTPPHHSVVFSAIDRVPDAPRHYEVTRQDPGRNSHQNPHQSHGVKAPYRLTIQAGKHPIHTSDLTEAEFSHLRNQLFELFLARDAKRPSTQTQPKKCDQLAMEIHLVQIKENHSICVEDTRTFFQAQAILSELIRNRRTRR